MRTRRRLATPPRRALGALGTLPALALALAGPACASAPHADDATRARLAALEAELAAQRPLLDQLARARRADDERAADLAARLARLEARPAAPAGRPPGRPAPDPAAVYAVPLDGAAVAGPADAPVTLVMAMDLACQFCQRAFATVDELRRRHPVDLRVAYLDHVVHARAEPAARLACAANRQGRWRAFVDLVWARAFPERRFDAATLDALAQGAGLDLRRARADAEGPCAEDLARTRARLLRLGVSATPTFYVNGRFLSGARPIEEFERLIGEERARAAAAIAGGVPAAAYYQRVVDGGLAEPAAPPPARP